MTDSRKDVSANHTGSIDLEQIREIAREFKPALGAYFGRRCDDPSMVDDLVQNVFIRLLRRKKAGEIEHVPAYVMQTASSVWNDHLRSEQSRNQYDYEEYDDVAHSPEGISPERVYQDREALSRVLALLQELPERTQDIYLLCRFDGLKRKDVAHRLGISISAIDKHLMAATKKVGTRIGDIL